MAYDEQGAFLERVTELNELVASPWIIDKEQDLRPPELDVLRLQPQQILSDLVVNEHFRD